MRLEALVPGVARESVAAHVPACAAAGGWDEVRLIDLANMVSGHYRLDGPEADEDSPATAPFFLAADSARKIAFACAQPRRSPPGPHFAYHTADSFLLGVAMTDVLERRGLGRDVYDDLIAPIWSSIGQSPMLDVTRRTVDGAALPFTGYGLAYTRDDIVRAARFLARGALVDGKPWLDRSLLEDALQRAAPGSGAQVFPRIVYRLGFWARDVAPLIGCARPVWVPFMSGYGGISVVMFPNDVRFWSFGEDDHFDWGEAAREVEKIRPLCR
jgi:CubicO group peptidase (beta-lactamase class C family)